MWTSNLIAILSLGVAFCAVSTDNAQPHKTSYFVHGRLPFESCSPGAPWYHAWKVFDTRVASVSSDDGLGRLRVQTKSIDSSIVQAFLYVLARVSGDEGAAAFFASNQDACDVKLSPFGEACVLIKPGSAFLNSEASVSVTWSAAGRRDWRAAALLVAVVLHRSAAALSEAWHVHYAVGVSFGLVFFLLMLCFFLANFVGATPGKRRLAVVASFLGYSAAVWHYFTRAAVGALGAYPRLFGGYVLLAVAASVLATRAVRASEVFFDAIYASCRVAAVAVAFNSTASVSCGAALAFAFVLAGLFDARPLFAFLFDAASAAAALVPSPSKARRDARNCLQGHAFQTPERFHEQGRELAASGMDALSRTPEFAAWVARNHARIGLTPPAEDGSL